MSTTSSELLNIMAFRLSMVERGVINPHPAVAVATKLLIERLGVLPSDETIQITFTESPLHARYIRASTGEVLAEIQLPNDA